MAVDADHHAAELLDTLLVTLLDAVGDGDGVAGTELVDFFLGGCESLFRNFHQIHDAFSLYFVTTTDNRTIRKPEPRRGTLLPAGTKSAAKLILICRSDKYLPNIWLGAFVHITEAKIPAPSLKLSEHSAKILRIIG